MVAKPVNCINMNFFSCIPAKILRNREQMCIIYYDLFRIVLQMCCESKLQNEV